MLSLLQEDKGCLVLLSVAYSLKQTKYLTQQDKIESTCAKMYKNFFW